MNLKTLVLSLILNNQFLFPRICLGMFWAKGIKSVTEPSDACVRMCKDSPLYLSKLLLQSQESHTMQQFITRFYMHKICDMAMNWNSNNTNIKWGLHV